MAVRVPAPLSRLAPWYAACVPLVAGCLYVGPPWEVPVNTPPVVILPVDRVTDVYLISDPTVLTAIARDPDGDVVHFEWSVPVGFQVGEQVDTTVEEGVYASTVAIVHDEDLDGVHIECVITDYQSIPSPQRFWLLEVGP